MSMQNTAWYKFNKLLTCVGDVCTSRALFQRLSRKQRCHLKIGKVFSKLGK